MKNEIASCPQAMEAYIRHTIDGQSMREVSRMFDTHASTILRQIRRVEDMREWEEWDEIIIEIGDKWDRNIGFSRAILFDVLGVNELEAIQELQRCIPTLSKPGAVIALTKDAMAGIICEQEIVRRVERRTALAWFAVGWLEAAQNGSRFRRYKLTDLARTEIPEERLSAAEVEPMVQSLSEPASIRSKTYIGKNWDSEPLHRLSVLSRRKGSQVGPAELDTAGELFELMRQAKIDGPGSARVDLLCTIQKKLGDEMFNLLYDYLHAGRGFEDLEKQYNWAARSAKIVMAIALKQVTHFKLLEGLEALGEEAR